MKEDFHKRLAALKTADAINAIKGVPVSADAKFLSEKWVRGELTGDETGVAGSPSEDRGGEKRG